MTRKRLLTAAVIALAAVPMPLATTDDAPFGVELSKAECAEGGCGYWSMADCFCPDMQFPNLKPQCDE